MKKKNLKNMKFGKLTVIEEKETSKHKGVIWKCQCECGNYRLVSTNNLIQGYIKKCKKCVIQKHGYGKTRLYRIWAGMKQRVKRDKNYLSKGVKVCDEWKESFISFRNWALKNGYNNSLSIDRIDNNGNYEPNNCRWATNIIQMNNMSTNHKITFENETHNISEWSRIKNISADVIRNRIRYRWNIELLFLPVSTVKHKKTTIQKDLNNNFIKEWTSLRQIQKELKYDHSIISKACKTHNPAYGYIWEYKKED